MFVFSQWRWSFLWFFLSYRLLPVCLPSPLSDNCVFTASMLGAGECQNTFPEPGRGWLEGGTGAEGSLCRGGSTDTSFFTCPGLHIVQLTDTWCEMLDPFYPFFFLRIGKGFCHPSSRHPESKQVSCRTLSDPAQASPLPKIQAYY